MALMRNFLLFTFTIVLLGNVSFAQHKCGTVLLQELQHHEIDYHEAEAEFEDWLKKKMTEKRYREAANARTSEVVTIPVVVHVIHNGEPIGTNSNIPEGQILSQIEILNQDFRRQNPDAVETPIEFIGAAADTEIEFAMAQRDPEGLPTNGIVRVQGSQSEYGILDDELLKSQSFWPSEDYLNIWVTNLSTLLGYAQFPVSNLGGLSIDDENNRLTDGIVVAFDFFGMGFNADPFSQGRTVTHEIGHFLGLRHIWGDGGCSRDDFCDDTPRMIDSSSGCPASQESCGSGDMYQNYMDFTDDDCMNLFTQCQSARMRTVLEESPRRHSLTQSLGATPPVLVDNDLGIRQVISPEVSICENIITPELELRNYGTNNIESFTIALTIDGTNVESLTTVRTLEPLAITSVIFQDVAVNEGDELDFSFEITEVNGVADGNAENNREDPFVQVPYQGIFPQMADFESGNDQWISRKFNGDRSNWQLVNAPLNTSDNTAFQLDLFNSLPENFGNLEMLLSPILDLEKVSSAELRFQYAYSEVPDNAVDGLTVAVLTNCGVVFETNNILGDFDLFGSDLATTTPKTGEFIPSGPTEWEEVNINLNAFIGLQNAQIALIAQDGGGNNIYVDDIELIAGDPFERDVRVTSFSQLPDVSCRDFQAPIIEIKNFGLANVISLEYEYNIGGISEQDRIDDFNLAPGETRDILVALPNLADGDFLFTFNVTSINGLDDEEPSDNSLSQPITIIGQSDILPIREKFEQRTLDELNWYSFSPDGIHDWGFSSTDNELGDNQSISIGAFNLAELGKQNWLVTPQLDLSGLAEASLQFEVSYAQRAGIEDKLEVLVSTDCGRTFPNLIYSKQGEDLAVTSSDNRWIPQSTADWVTESVDLTSYAGSSEVLVAFVFTNANGNDFYLDNIDFFLSSDPFTVPQDAELVRIFPNPSPDDFNIIFNLEQKEAVSFRLIDMMGNQIFSHDLDNVLNQTYSYPIHSLRNGLYLVQLIGESFKQTERLVVMK